VVEVTARTIGGLFLLKPDLALFPTTYFEACSGVHSRYGLHDRPLDSIQLFQRLQPVGRPLQLLRRLPRRTDNSSDGSLTGWPSRP
jgi:hypothetical protein